MPDPITYAELQKELIEEAHLLLGMAVEMLGEPPDAVVDEAVILACQARYHDHPPAVEGVSGALAKTTGRARVSCGR